MAAYRSDLPSIGRQEKSTGTRALVVLSLLSIVLLTVGMRTGQGGFISLSRSFVDTLTSPVRFVGSWALSPLQGFSNILGNITASQESLSELRTENEELRRRNVELEEAEMTAERLSALLDIRTTYELSSVAARIISGSKDSWTSTVMLDKGALSGLEVGMAVLDSSGIVGQIIEVSPTTSTVRLLIDESSSISAMVQSTRAQGEIRGSAQEILSLDLVSVDMSLEVGDIVITSGLDGVFPKGLPLARITGVERSPGDLYYDIVCEPLAHATNLEEVLVITSITDDQRASAADVVDADAQERGDYRPSESEDTSTEAVENTEADTTNEGEEAQD